MFRTGIIFSGYSNLVFYYIALSRFMNFASGFDRHKPAYILYNEKGREVNYRNMMKHVKDADILLFAEIHGNPISHWLQLEVTRDLFNKLDGNDYAGRANYIVVVPASMTRTY